MKITELLAECKINDFDMDEFLHIHPKQLISDSIPIPIWRIHYSYFTARGNPKDALKYWIGPETDWDVVEEEFKRYIENENEKHPERKISNVEILDISFMGEALIELE